MWEWMARTGATYKELWPGWETQGGQYEGCMNYCFACDYVEHNSCQDCPLALPEGHKQGHSCLGGLFNKWATFADVVKTMNRWGNIVSIDDDYKEFYDKALYMLKKTAKQISELPVKNGVKTI